MSKLCRAMSEFTWYYVKWCTDATVGFAKDFKHRKGIISLCIFCIRYCCCKSDILLLHQFMNSCIFTRVYAVTFLEEYRQRFRSLCVPEFATNGTGIAPVVNLMWNIGVLGGQVGLAAAPPLFFSDMGGMFKISSDVGFSVHAHSSQIPIFPVGPTLCPLIPSQTSWSAIYFLHICGMEYRANQILHVQ